PPTSSLPEERTTKRSTIAPRNLVLSSCAAEEPVPNGAPSGMTGWWWSCRSPFQKTPLPPSALPATTAGSSPKLRRANRSPYGMAKAGSTSGTNGTARAWVVAALTSPARQQDVVVVFPSGAPRTNRAHGTRRAAQRAPGWGSPREIPAGLSPAVTLPEGRSALLLEATASCE